MPIYEFRCEECNAVSEFSMKMSDPNPTTCPKCKADSLKKMISKSGFQLKGGGWFADSYCSTKNSSNSSSACSTCPNSN